MKAYTLKRAKELVRAFNITRAVPKAAVAIGMETRDAREILVWLERQDKDNSPHQMTGPYLMAAPLARTWARFLFEHGISAGTAAAAVNWPLQRVFEKVAPKCAWEAAACDRKKKPARIALDDTVDDEPSAEEKAEQASRLAELRAKYDAMERPLPRVEVREVIYDGRTVSFDAG
jgi:type II secretory pathway component PulJ